MSRAIYVVPVVLLLCSCGSNKQADPAPAAGAPPAVASTSGSKHKYAKLIELAKHATVPVNPGIAGRVLHGAVVAARLDDALPLDMVDVFRRSSEAGAAVDEAIRLGARSVWLQLGVVDDAAGERARAAGLRFVQDRCPVIEWRRLGLPPRVGGSA